MAYHWDCRQLTWIGTIPGHVYSIVYYYHFRTTDIYQFDEARIAYRISFFAYKYVLGVDIILYVIGITHCIHIKIKSIWL